MKIFKLIRTSLSTLTALVLLGVGIASAAPTSGSNLPGGSPLVIAFTGNKLTLATQGPQDMVFKTNDTTRFTINGSTGVVTGITLGATALDPATTFTTLTQSGAGTLAVGSSGSLISSGKSIFGTSLSTFTDADSAFAPSKAYVAFPSDTNIGESIMARVAGTNGASLYFWKTRQASDFEGDTIVNASDQLAIIKVYGSNGTNYSLGSQMIWTVDATPGAVDMPTAWDLQLSPDGTATPSSVLKITNQALATFTGAITMATAGQPLTIKTGAANAVAGTFVCNGVTGVVVNTTNASASMVLAFSPNTIAGTAPIGSPYVSAFTAGTSFTVKCSVAGETSTYNWAMIKTN